MERFRAWEAELDAEAGMTRIENLARVEVASAPELRTRRIRQTVERAARGEKVQGS